MTTITRTRIRTLLAATAIAAFGWGIAAPASAALIDNGSQINGVDAKGASPIGPQDGFDFGTTTVLGLE